MKSFLHVLAGLVVGVLSGFDRLVFRGHLRQLSYDHGMECYLSANHVLHKDFEEHVQAKTAQLLKTSLAEAHRLERPLVYLNSSTVSKEEKARPIAAKDGIGEGLICVLKCVEPCWTFEMHRNRQEKRLELQGKVGKCAFLYHYWHHPLLGFLHARIQTWFPFAVQVAVNGREWLARPMDQAGLSYQRRDNKFTWLEDCAQAQKLLDQQVQMHWPELLGGILHAIPPTHPEFLGRLPVDYYWSVYQSEWASDVLLRSRADLERLYPQLVRHALLTYGSADVMSFLGRRVPYSGQVDRRFEGEVSSNLCRREEGLRVKHWVNGNSIKMYDCDRVLRIETTINDPSDFKVFRPKEGDPKGKPAWREMRRGVADLPRRAQVSQAANERYAQATAAVKETTPLRHWSDPLCRRVRAAGKKTTRQESALNPLGPEDAALLRAVSDAKFTINGLRNRDLVALLYAKPAGTPAERRRRSARVTRQIRLLRAHGLLHKVPKTHRYQVSDHGRKAITALLAARNANADTLTSNAA